MSRFSINQVKSVCFVGFWGVFGCCFLFFLGGYFFSQTYIDSIANSQYAEDFFKFVYHNESQKVLFLFSNNLNVVVVVFVVVVFLVVGFLLLVFCCWFFGCFFK